MNMITSVSPVQDRFSLEIIDDPAQMAATQTSAGLFTNALACRGTQSFISNASSTMLLLKAGPKVGPFLLPMSIDDGGYGRSYVASPHSAYVAYAKREMDLVQMRRGRAVARAAITGLDWLLRGIQMNQVVHLDNWLLSTNLHGAWKGEGLSVIRQMLTGRWPRHFLILRSLDSWSSPELLQAARDDGWILVPARQIWVVDDLECDWRPRRDCANDRRLLKSSGLHVEDISKDKGDRLSMEDEIQIADLYRQLYIEKYSGLNPVFTPDFIALLFNSGMISYRIARDCNSKIRSVAGMWDRAGVMTTPVIGYDTARPQSDGLYRIASYMLCDWAAERRLKMHASAGAAHFKRQRGAHGEIEYMAVYAGHLSAARRASVSGLAKLLETAIVPMMRREGW